MAKSSIPNPLKGLWLRGGVYWFAETVPGYGRVRASLKTSDPAEAINQARLRRAFPTRYFSENAGTAVEGYLEHQRQRGVSQARIVHARGALTELAKRAPKEQLEHLSSTAAAQWWQDLLKRVHAKSAKDYLGHARLFFRWALDAGRVKASPVALIVPPKVRPVPRRMFLTPEDAIRVLDECKDHDLKFALYCALHCGLRKGEIIAARPRWFDLKVGLLHVQNERDWLTKDRDNRTIPMTAEFKTFLQSYGIRSPYMFRPDVLPKPTNKTWRYRTDFVKVFEGHMKKLKLEEFTFHDLRRTFASLHVSYGTPIYHVAKWLGDDIAIVEKTYAHLLPNDPRINDPWTSARASAKPKRSPKQKGEQLSWDAPASLEK